MACCISVWLAAGTSAALAQSANDEDLRLRGIVVEDDGLSGAQRRSDLRAADRLTDTDAQTDVGEIVVDDESLTTGAVQPVQTSETLNPRQTTIDNQANLIDDQNPFDPVGLRIGNFILRPSVTEQIAYEIDNDGSTHTERTYSRTVFNAELESDWSRHQLTINGEQVIDKTLSGDGAEDPSTSVDADLRLDLSSNTTSNLTFDYEFGRENQTDANALSNAFVQSDVHQFDASASLDHVVGSWRGIATLSGGRSTFGNAQLSDGTTVTQSDRDENDYTVTLRAGVDIGAAHLPFVEGDFGQIIYDDTLDSSGFARSSKTYGLRLGTAFDFGEKVNGEISAGYAQRDIDDSRLAPIKGFTVDGSATWSPRRGTDVVMNLTTTLEDSTTANESGSVYYAASAEITHQLRENVTTNMSALVGWRDYTAILNSQLVYGAGAGFTWWLNRHFGLEGGVSYEKTATDGGDDSDNLFVGLGVTLRP
jgi:hypothetical protein